MIESFSTRAVGRDRKAEFWNNLVGQTYSGLSVDALDTQFDAHLFRWSMDGLMLMRPRSAASVVARRSHVVQDAATQKLTLHIGLSGHLGVTHRGHDIALGVGDMVVCASEEFYRFDCKERHELLVVEMDREPIAQRLPQLDDQLGRLVSGRLPSTRLLADFMISLWREGLEGLDDHLRGDYANTLTDLIVASLRAAGQPAPERHAPLFDRLRALVNARYADPDLTPSALAGELGVTLRALQLAAAKAGTTPGACIERHRLDMAARRLICDPSVSVAQIAYDSGFTDSGYFSRRFSQQFGMAPRSFRAR